MFEIAVGEANEDPADRTPADGPHLPGVAAVGTREVGNDWRDGRRIKLLSKLAKKVLSHPRERDGGDRVDVDVVFGPLQPQHVHQPDEACFGGPVIGLTEIPKEP